MSGFSADWLALRERADARARSRLAATLPSRYPAVIDLGAGTGANLRWLAPQLESPQDWALIDNDAALLDAACPAIRAWAEGRGCRLHGRGSDCTLTGPDIECRIATRRLDLDRELDALEWPAGCLVTASALLDLVSGPWLEGLVTRIAGADASVLWTLSYDGSVAFEPGSDADETIVALVNRHQATDKGFGPALGPEGWLAAHRLLERAGFDVRAVDSSWHLDGGDGALIEALITGWADAAIAVAPAETSAIRRWRNARLARAAEGRLAVSVGHRDLAASPRRASRGSRRL